MPPDAPDGEVGFAIPGVVRPGQAVPVTEASMRQAVREAAARDLKSTPEAAVQQKSTEQRLDALEKDVQSIKSLMGKIEFVIDRLDQQQRATK